MRVLVLLVRYGSGKYGDALLDLDRIYQRYAPGVTRMTFVIDNALPGDLTKNLADNIVLMGGDNTQWEFSGWQRAIDAVDDEITGYDVIHFVTSAFRTHYTAYLDRFSERIVEAVAERPIATGHIDYYPYPIRLGTYVSRHWIRSSFWLINTVELLRLRGLITIADDRGLFSTQGDWPFAEGALLSRGYQELIHRWLTSSQGTGQSVEWHSRFDLSDETRTLFQDKSIAIMNEHLLSIRLRAQGTHLLDMTYLAEITEAKEPFPQQFPSWRTQLQLRGISGHDHIDDVVWR
jgi:hypothetical protein